MTQKKNKKTKNNRRDAKELIPNGDMNAMKSLIHK